MEKEEKKKKIERYTEEHPPTTVKHLSLLSIYFGRLAHYYSRCSCFFLDYKLIRYSFLKIDLNKLIVVKKWKTTSLAMMRGR